MRIGIDCRTMLNPEGGERAGVGHYTTHLVTELVQRRSKKDTYVLFFDHTMPASAFVDLKSRENVEIIRFPFSEHKRYLPVAYSHIFIASVLRKANVDVFHSPAYIIPLQYGRPSVVTIHDLAIYKHPSWFPSGQKFSRRVTVPKSIQKAATVISVSKATEKNVKRLFKVPAVRSTVVYEGFSKGPRVSAAKKDVTMHHFGIHKRFVFFVSTIEPRKNVERLVKAFDHFMNHNHHRYRDLQLVIAGGKGWKHEGIFRTIARAKWSGNIRVIGYVTHEEKVALMERAMFFAFPSLWEGFGLPVLESLSVGTPVLTSKLSALPEVAGPGAVYVNPESVRDIQHGFTSLVKSKMKRDSLARKGREYVKQFSWKRCANETYDVYSSVVENFQKNKGKK